MQQNSTQGQLKKKGIVVFLNQNFISVKILLYISIKGMHPFLQAKTSEFKM